jgi:cytochrome c-type biogenesis protein CcsB
MTETFVTFSLVAIWSAMAMYALAFIAFTFDLARRATPTPVEASVANTRVTSAVGATSRGTAVLDREDDASRVILSDPAPATPAPGSSAGTPGSSAGTGTPGKAPTSRWARIGMSITVLAWILHAGGTIFRGVAAGRVPWANMFEFALTATVIIVGVFLLVQFWQDIKFLGAYVTGFALLFLGIATVNFYVDVVPLPPALQSWWLIIHVFVASLGTGFFALGAGLSIVQLFQASGQTKRTRLLSTLPSATSLENTAYRLVVIGFVFWTFTLIAGAIWAESAWGRYWGWDTKEVWTFIIWVIFAGYIHARATRGWRGSRSAWLAIIGFAAVIFNFTIVNLFFKGLHAYSGLM